MRMMTALALTLPSKMRRMLTSVIGVAGEVASNVAGDKVASNEGIAAVSAGGHGGVLPLSLRRPRFQFSRPVETADQLACPVKDVAPAWTLTQCHSCARDDALLIWSRSRRVSQDPQSGQY